jgi:hypothetical protein
VREGTGNPKVRGQSARLAGLERLRERMYRTYVGMSDARELEVARLERELALEDVTEAVPIHQSMKVLLGA